MASLPLARFSPLIERGRARCRHRHLALLGARSALPLWISAQDHPLFLPPAAICHVLSANLSSYASNPPPPPFGTTQLRQTGENNCLLDNRWSQIKNEAAKISAVGARIKPASLPANTVAPKQAAPALTKPAPIPKEAAAMFASKPKPAPSSSGGQKGCAAVKPSVVAKSSLAAKPAAPAPTPSTSASASAPIAVSTNSKKRRAIESDEEDEEVEPTVAKSCAKDEMAVKERPVSEKNADEKNSPPVAAPAAGKTKPGGVAAMFAARTAVEANTTAINKDGGKNSNTEIRSGSFEHVTAAAVQGTIKKGGEKAHPVSNPSKKQVAVGAKPHAKDHVDTSQTPQRSEVGARAAAETTEMCAYSSGKRAADAHEEEEAERKRRKEERRKVSILPALLAHLPRMRSARACPTPAIAGVWKNTTVPLVACCHL